MQEKYRYSLSPNKIEEGMADQGIWSGVQTIIFDADKTRNEVGIWIDRDFKNKIGYVRGNCRI